MLFKQETRGFELSKYRDARIRRSFKYRYNTYYKYRLVDYARAVVGAIPDVLAGISIFALLYLINIAAHLFH